MIRKASKYLWLNEPHMQLLFSVISWSQSSNREDHRETMCVPDWADATCVKTYMHAHTHKYLLALILQSPAVIDIRLLKSRETPQRILNNLWHFLTVCSPLLPFPPQASQQNKYFQWINKSKWHYVLVWLLCISRVAFNKIKSI